MAGLRLMRKIYGKALISRRIRIIKDREGNQLLSFCTNGALACDGAGAGCYAQWSNVAPYCEATVCPKLMPSLAEPTTALPELATKAQVARYLQCSPATVDRKRRTGELPSFKLGRLVRFHASAVRSLAPAVIH